MGGEYSSHAVEDCSEAELTETYRQFHESQCYDHGHSGYSGTFAEKPELDILSVECQTDEQAEEHCIDKNDKWGPAFAVKVLTPEPHWYIGGWCSS